MEEIGVVKEINGIKALIIVRKKGTCDSCSGSSLCETFGVGEAIMEAFNKVDARVGDTVKVVFRESTYLKGTIIVYGIPSLMLLLGAMLGKEYLKPFFPAADPELLSAAAGFGLFAFTFLVLKLWSKVFEPRKEYMPIIEEIINRG
ncbi:MAG: SoxR reducing system RseC family protein [Nitrospirae bacterium]|nr:SoxR reducing system RseC family protein [Nitrospirota bacterium]